MMVASILRLSPSVARLPSNRLIAQNLTRTAIHQFSTSARDAISIPPEYTYTAPDEWYVPVVRRDFQAPKLGGHATVDKVKEPLHDCILNGDLRRLRELLSAELFEGISTLPRRATKAERGRHTPNGTPLQFAACLGDLAAVDALLDAGADPSWAVKDHRLVIDGYLRRWAFTPLHLAILYGHREVVAHLWNRITAGMKDVLPTSRDEAKQGQPKEKSNLSNCLFLAAHAGHTDIVEDLLSSGYQWSFGDFKGALKVAAGKWNPNVTDALLSWNGACGPMDLQGALDMALGSACRAKYDRLLQVWYEALPCSGLDHVNRSALIARLIKAGANPNRTENGGMTLLMCAASEASSTGALKALLENGADPNIISEEFGTTALSFAAEAVVEYRVDASVERPKFMWNETALKLLLEYGASGTIRGPDGTTPLHMAARTSNLRFLGLIARADQQPRSPLVLPPSILQLENNRGETLLHHACLGGRLDIISMLLDHGLDVNQRTKQGLTPLLCALKLSDEWKPWWWHDPITDYDNWTHKTTTIAVQAAHLLISRGAEFRSESDDGRTALYILCSLRDGSYEPHRGLYKLALQLLKQNKALITSPMTRSTPPTKSDSSSNGDGSDSTLEPWRNTPLLHWAVQKQSLAVVKALVDMGADISATDANGYTAVRAAKEMHKTQDISLGTAVLRLLEGQDQ